MRQLVKIGLMSALAVILCSQTLMAQDSLKLSFWEHAPQPNPKRIKTIGYGYAGAYTVTMLGLNQLWYADFERSPFQFFNDNNEWLQMDKIGHLTTAYYTGWAGIKVLKWAGMPQRKAMWYGPAGGWLFLATIEVFDGFSAEWGFSHGDMVVNTAGSALAILQEGLWQEQKFLFKFSYAPSDFADYRPESLGFNWNERILKDYNGQTYWVSTPINTFLGEQSPVPNWLSVSFGYSGEGMLGGTGNPPANDAGEPLPDFQRYRQYFLSLDVDLTRIKTKSPLLNTLLFTFGYIKVPFPALEYSQQGFRFNPTGN